MNELQSCPQDALEHGPAIC